MIKFSGKYILKSDSYDNLDIRASNVIIDGQGNTLYGWIHIGNEFHRANNVKIMNLNIKPKINIYNYTDDACTVCSAKIFTKETHVKAECAVYAHGNNCVLENCNFILNPKKETDSHVTISHTQNSNINGISIVGNDNTIHYISFDEK